MGQKPYQTCKHLELQISLLENHPKEIIRQVTKYVNPSTIHGSKKVEDNLNGQQKGMATLVMVHPQNDAV